MQDPNGGHEKPVGGPNCWHGDAACKTRTVGMENTRKARTVGMKKAGNSDTADEEPLTWDGSLRDGGRPAGSSSDGLFQSPACHPPAHLLVEERSRKRTISRTMDMCEG